MKRALIAMFVVLLGLAVDAAPKPEPWVLPYLEGLDNLEKGDYSAASKSFDAALEAESENPSLYIARAVSYILAENFAPAEKDLLRAQRLDQTRKDTRLWLATIYSMKGDFMKSSATYPAATHDQFENLVSDVGRGYGELSFREKDPYNAPYLDQPRKQRAAAKARFPEVAGAFSQRYKTTLPDLGPLLFDRANQLMAKKDWAGALNNLEQARRTNPKDPKLLHFIAFCNVHLGAPAGAREQFTAVLTANPTWASSFAGRAMAAAALGDMRRAQTDLERACALNPAEAERYRALVDEAVKNNPAPQMKREEISGRVQDLYAAARSKATDEELLTQAIAIIKGMNAYRLRADETYFDHRSAFEEKAKTNDPDRLADLAEFLWRQANVRHSEKVELRAEARPYRSTNVEAETAYAEQCCDRVLAANPNHVKALTYKACCLMDRGKYGDAETLLKRASAVDPGYGPLLQSYSRLLNWCAWVRYCKANDLRSTKYAGEDAHYYYYRHPSQAELAEADRLEAEANKLAAWARQQLETAARNYAGKPLGYYYTGILANHQSQPDAARAAFEEAVKLDPKFEAAWDELSTLYFKAGMLRETAEAKSQAVNLSHSTGGHMLRYAWIMIGKTKYKTANQALLRAIDYDPADPRAAAYLAVIAQGDNRPDNALAWFRTAAAMEEARARLNGTSSRSVGSSPIPASAAGFPMTINNRLGRLALAQDRPEVAIEAFSRNLGLQKRIPKSEYFTPIASSMLPDEDIGDVVPKPEAEIPISQFMWAHEGIGEALLKQGKEEQAIQSFQTCMSLPKLRHPTQPPGSRMGDPFMTAKINMVKMFVAKNDLQKAWIACTSGEQPNGVSKELSDEMRRLGREVDQKRATQRYAEHDREVEAARAKQQEEIDKIMKQRQEQDAARRAEYERIRKQQEEIDKRRRGTR